MHHDTVLEQSDSVFNQSTPLVDIDLFSTDRALVDAVDALADDRPLSARTSEAVGGLAALGRQLGSTAVLEQAELANRYPPRFVPFDRFGHRVDEVEFHPAWHALMAMLIGSGVHAESWTTREPRAHLVRAAKYLMFAQVENGTQCPVTMTFAAMPLLQKSVAECPLLADRWLPRIASREYDPRSIPVEQKRGALIGMGMTERQGGSDVRSNTTRAVHVGAAGDGDEYRLHGHKWFFSVPQADAHLVLAQTDPGSAAGITCFFMPRFLPGGTRNLVRIQRLKDKVGNRSNASSEVELDGATAWRIGETGRGIQTILEMGNLTRLDCAIGSAGQIRAVVAQALHHASQRRAFGRLLGEQPLMRNVLADLALESEAATWLVLRLALAYDRRGEDALEDALARVLTPVAKYWVCKRGPAAGAEAMEVLGGNGYVEDAPLGRFYRELPLNSIWEGSGNIMCLDLLRALARSPGSVEALQRELAAASGADARYDAFVARLGERLRGRGFGDEADARRLAGDIAVALQGSQLLRHAPAYVGDAFCASRLDEAGWGRAFGTLPPGCDCAAIVERAMPH